MHACRLILRGDDLLAGGDDDDDLLLTREYSEDLLAMMICWR
jgi:hypothetical protein